MRKSFLLGLIFLAVQASTAFADQRYDIVCVTSVSAPGKVLVYDTLISTYAEEYNYDALTYLREAASFSVDNQVGQADSWADIQKKQTHKTEYKNNDFPGSWNEKGLRVVSGARVVIATRKTITISDSRNTKVEFKIPFINPDLTPAGEVKSNDLIFNGQAVSSVNYRICGGGAD